MFYFFKSKTGTFSIEPDETCDGMFKLCIGGFWLDSYETAESAARDVYLHATGWYEWDRLEDSTVPCDLGEWELL